MLEKRQHILGDEHPGTISAMNNLAITHGMQQKGNKMARFSPRMLLSAMKKRGNSTYAALETMSWIDMDRKQALHALRRRGLVL